MSLDVYLRLAQERNGNAAPRARIYVRRDGQTVEITRSEWDEMYPGRAPFTVTEEGDEDDVVYDANITHNLGGMARQVLLHGDRFECLYDVLWRPDEHGLTHARDLVDALRDGLAFLQSDPDYFKRWNPRKRMGRLRPSRSLHGWLPHGLRGLARCRDRGITVIGQRHGIPLTGRRS